MAAKINTVGAITLKNLRREGGAESVDVAASMALKRTFGDTALTLRLTEAAFTDLKSLNGALLTVSKAVGAVVVIVPWAVPLLASLAAAPQNNI